MNNRQWLAGMCGVALALAGAGLTGCDDDDGAEETESIQTVVVTTNDAGVVKTNSVEAPAAPAAEAAFFDVAGRWNGIIVNTTGDWANIDLYLDQDGGTITGEGYLQGGGQRAHNTVAGTLSGNHLVLILTSDTVKPDKLTVEKPTTDMDGHLDASGTEYEGTWTDGFIGGTFALQKSLVD